MHVRTSLLLSPSRLSASTVSSLYDADGKFISAFQPRSLMAALSYACAASSTCRKEPRCSCRQSGQTQYRTPADTANTHLLSSVPDVRLPAPGALRGGASHQLSHQPERSREPLLAAWQARCDARLFSQRTLYMLTPRKLEADERGPRRRSRGEEAIADASHPDPGSGAGTAGSRQKSPSAYTLHASHALRNLASCALDACAPVGAPALEGDRVEQRVPTKEDAGRGG